MRHVPRKRFGQHFLTDEAVIAHIVAAIAPQPADRMIEIGPGLGALTRPLLARLEHLHVVEIDRDIVARLKRAFPPERLTVHEGDALRFDFSALGPRLRVIGNLPYNISTPLLFHLARSAAAIHDIHVMLQKEVVARMVAQPASADYGRLSVMLQYRFQLEKILDIPAAAFRPAPKVESATVCMVPLRRGAVERCGESLFTKLVAAAFSQRRKTLRNTLKSCLGEDDFAELGLDPQARAQELSVADFVRIANHVAARDAVQRRMN
ncbi:MAG: 16S rRNA (adenine(1518)-N(6)/adenine(1519)-N(6))-dimethyltransferase [Betaproteobacteria bacterium RIFCSPLOWO2_12_FULL_62_13]|nr:MAG: 16S rRNA (adenine(1518)-N(6)/adenine(1519)-N(6))-dimethyltransferase [Betaproteobacteria bacterium RIFCSPLOWO2_12_FULL_62_13]